MPRNSVTIKASTHRQAKSRSKVIEWKSRELSRGIKDVPVEVSAMASKPKPRKNAGRWPRAETNDPLQGETASQSMEVDETFWVEEPVMRTREKRVSQSVCPSSMNLTYFRN
jgi:hypothetical protein